MSVQLTQQAALSEAVRLVSNTVLGVLVTVDSAGIAQPRWMGAASIDSLKKVYCLTAKNTRQLEQINRHPNVTWMFTRDKGDQVVPLYGKAQLLYSPLATQQVWDRLIEIGEPYFVSTMGENSSTELVTIETLVEKIEFLSPRNGIFEPMTIPIG